jgi:hypothetical protein
MQHKQSDAWPTSGMTRLAGRDNGVGHRWGARRVLKENVMFQKGMIEP